MLSNSVVQILINLTVLPSWSEIDGLEAMCRPSKSRIHEQGGLASRGG